MPNLPAIHRLAVAWLRNSPRFSVAFDDGVIWNGGRLEIMRIVPDTVAAALRGQPFDRILDHPLLTDMTISSARTEDALLIVQARPSPTTSLSATVSTGNAVPLDMMETLRALGIRTLCRVACEAMRRLDHQEMQALLDRMVAAHAAGRTEIPIIDLLGRHPKGVTSMGLSIKEDAVTTSARFHNGSFVTGRLSCLGTSKSRATCFSSRMFDLYKGSGPGYVVRKPTTPSWTIEQFEADLASRRRLMEAAWEGRKR